MLDFVVNLSLLTSGNFNSGISPAVKGLEDLQRKTQALQKTSANVSSLQKLEGQMQTNTAAMNTARLEAQQMGQRVQELQAKSASLSEQHGQASAKVQELSARLQANTAEYVKAAEQMQALTAAGQQNTAEFQQAQLTANKLAMQEKQLSRELKTASQQEKNFAREIKAADKEANRLTAEQQKLTQEADKLQSGLDRDRESLVNMRSALTEAGVNTDNLSSAQERLQQQLSDSAAAQDKLSQAQAKYEGYKQSLNWGNMKNDIMTSAGAVMAFQKPVQVMMDFEQAMANVRAVNGADDTQFKMLRDQALELGRTTQFSASQAANTQEALARGGFDPKQIVDAMPSVLAMAAAEGMELSQAGDIIVKTLGGMGYKDAQGNVDASQSGRVADVLANMSASSATNIAELGEGMKIAAPVMSQLGVSIEQLGAYLGGMANKGFVGSEAGNALASSAMRLSKLPKDTYNALADLKVSTRTKEGKMREFPDIMKAINEAFNKRKMGEAERMNYLARIFGTGQGKAMLGFMDAAVSGQIDTLEVSNKTQAQGKSQAMADVRNNTLVGDLAGLSSAWEGFMISVGKPLEDWTRNIVQGLTKAISWITQLMKEHEGLADVIVKVVAGLGALKVGFSVYNISKNITGLVGAFFQLKAASAGAAAAMQGASSAGGIFSSLGGLVKGVWGVIMAHPFVAIGAAVTAAAILIYQNWDKIKETAAKCWEAVKEFASSASQWVKDKWQSVSDWWYSWSLADIFAPLKQFADSASQWAKDKWQSVNDWFSSWSLPNIFDGLSNFASTAIADIKGLFSSFGDWIMNTIGKLNPFNWEMPSWLGGGQTKEQKQAYHNRGQDALQSAFGAPEFAVGGIVAKHSLIQVAENGPEAIIPLTDKSRGTELLTQTANILGVPLASDITSHDTYSSLNKEHSFARDNSFSSIMDRGRDNSFSSIMDRGRDNSFSSIMDRGRDNSFSSIMNTATRDNSFSSFMNSARDNSFTESLRENNFSSALSDAGQSFTFQQGNNSVSLSDMMSSIERSNNYVRDNTQNTMGLYSGSDYSRSTGQPQINITVNSSANNDNNGLADLIARKVQEALQNFQERQERLAYA